MRPPISLPAVRHRLLAPLLLALAAAGWGCATVPRSTSIACSRVALEPAPPWTVSVVWDGAAEELVLVDPARRGFAVYGRDGRRRREVALDPAAQLDYSVPMRLERSAEGYALIDRTQVLHLDRALAAARREQPFAALAAQGLIEGSLGDGVFARGVFYGYADVIDSVRKPADDPEASGTWRRGFVRLEPARAKLDFLHELPLEVGGEYTAYYYYDRRPYVAELGDKVFVLRFTTPWSLHRVAGRELRRVATGSVGEGGEEASALHAWNGRLYVLTARVVADAAESAAQAPELQVQDEGLRATLLEARAVAGLGSRVWTLHEIDPRRGRVLRRLELPSSAERLRLVPAPDAWIGIEEAAAPNVGETAAGTTLLFLPAHEIAAGDFSCAPGGPLSASAYNRGR